MRISIKILSILIMLIPFLSYAQYDKWLNWSNWLIGEEGRSDGSSVAVRSPIAVWSADYGITTVDTGGTYPTVSNWLSTNGKYNAYHLTADNRPLYYQDSVAIKFDGVDDGLQCNDGGVFNPGTGDFSAFAWVYIPYEDTSDEYIFDKYILCKGSGHYTYSPGWRFYITTVDTVNNTINFYYSIGSTNYVFFNGGFVTTFTTGGWFHVGVVADRDDTYSFYLNGLKLHSADISAYVNENVQSIYFFKIGASDSNVYNYHSFIAEARYYNIALTESEIQALYNAGRPQRPLASGDNKTFNYLFDFILR